MTYIYNLCLIKNIDYLINIELYIKPPYAELCVKPYIEPLYIELYVELYIEFCIELYIEPYIKPLSNKTILDYMRLYKIVLIPIYIIR